MSNAVRTHALNALFMPPNLLFAAAVYSLSAVICTTIGAAVMRHFEHDAYSILWSARVGAVGGAILAIPLMLFGILLAYAIPASDTIGDLAMGAASSAGAAALGCKVLILSLGAEHVKQGVKESAIAGGVGAAVWIAAGLALAIILSILFCAFGGAAFFWAGTWRTDREILANDNATEHLPMMRI